jgi:hypothetical protein
MQVNLMQQAVPALKFFHGLYVNLVREVMLENP